MGPQAPWENGGSIYREDSLWTETLRGAEDRRHFSKENGVREDYREFILAREKIQWNIDSGRVNWQRKARRLWPHHKGMSSEVVWTHSLEDRKQHQLRGHATCVVPQYSMPSWASGSVYRSAVGCLEILTNFVFECVFCKWSPMGQWCQRIAEKVYAICMSTLSCCFVHMWDSWRPMSSEFQWTYYAREFCNAKQVHIMEATSSYWGLIICVHTKKWDKTVGLVLCNGLQNTNCIISVIPHMS